MRQKKEHHSINPTYKQKSNHISNNQASVSTIPGPPGPTGIPGPPGESYCKNSVKYAVYTIREANPNQDISLISISNTKTGIISGFQPNGDVVNIIETTTENIIYVSLCNVIFITFPDEPNIIELPQYDHDTISQCHCNEDVESSIKTILNSFDFPIDIELIVDLVDALNTSYEIKKVYGICNGILWVEFTNTVEISKRFKLLNNYYVK